MVEYLKAQPEATFEEMRTVAEDAGHTIYPATFGRAQARAGILDDIDPPHAAAPTPAPQVAPAAPSSLPLPKPPTPSPRKGAPRPAPSEAVKAMETFITAWIATTEDKETLRSAIERMLEVIHSALEER
jgi:hypothetical protein